MEGYSEANFWVSVVKVIDCYSRVCIDSKRCLVVLIIVAGDVGLIANTAVMDSDSAGEGFNWHLALSSRSYILIWMDLCLRRIGFRSA